ncbi:TonB-dependent receptor [Pseudothauera rhizosphaerae]|nr:TonB-dependent receptor [Pseudothauera rhizosphaerae]
MKPRTLRPLPSLRPLSLACAGLLQAGAVLAAEPVLAPLVVQESPDALPYSSLPPSERTALPVSVQAEQTFTREDIEALRPRDVFDLMETTLGMSITRQGSRINNFSSNRGGNVSFLIDGVYLTGTQAQRVVGDIPVGIIESIQFIRDASVLSILPVMGFGSRVGTQNQGVVVINTLRKAGTEDSAQVKASYGTHDTWKASGGFKQSWADGRLQLGGGYQHSESNGKNNWNNAYDSDTYMLNGGWKDDAFMAMASVFVNQGAREIQRYIGVSSDPTSGLKKGQLGAELWEYDPRDMEVFTLNLARYWNERHTTALTWGRSKADGTAWYYTTTADPATIPGRRFKDESTDLHLSHTITGERNTFKAGAQRVEYTQVTEWLATAEPKPREEEIYGLYLTDEFRITPAWSIDGSIRMDKKHVSKGGDKYGSDGSTMKLSDDTWTDKAWLAALGTAWQVNPVWRLSGRYAWSKTPTPDTITTVDDKSLPDEKLHRWELGVDARLYPALNVSFTPFYYLIEDAKVADASAPAIPVFNPDTGLYENLSVYTTADKVTRKGFELALKGRFANDMLGYELGWSRFKDDSVELGTNNVETPENRYTARLNAAYGAWSGTLSVLRVEEYCHFYKTGATGSAPDGTCLPVPAFTTVNLNVSRKFGHGVTVSLYGQNITDEHYFTRHKTGAGGPAWSQSNGAIADVGATWGIEVGMEF